MTTVIIVLLVLALCLTFGRMMGNTAYSIHHAKATGKAVRSEKDQEQTEIERFSR